MRLMLESLTGFLEVNQQASPWERSKGEIVVFIPFHTEARV